MRICGKCGGVEHVLETRPVAMKLGATGVVQVSGLVDVERCVGCNDVWLPFTWSYGDKVNLVPRDPVAAPPEPAAQPAPPKGAKKRRRK